MVALQADILSTHFYLFIIEKMLSSIVHGDEVLADEQAGHHQVITHLYNPLPPKYLLFFPKAPRLCSSHSGYRPRMKASC